MKIRPILLLLTLLSSGCTYVRYEKDGTKVTYFSMKNSSADSLRFGDFSAKDLRTDASEVAGQVAEGVARGAKAGAAP